MTLQDWANVATIAGVAGLFVAYEQLKTSREVQQEATAIAVWKDYLQTALDHPELAEPELYVVLHEHGTTKYRRYEWFVSTMLFASEQVLTLADGHAWKRTIEAQLRLHAQYFHTVDFDPTLYDPKLVAMIEQVTREEQPHPNHAPGRLRILKAG